MHLAGTDVYHRARAHPVLHEVHHVRAGTSRAHEQQVEVDSLAAREVAGRCPLREYPERQHLDTNVRVEGVPVPDLRDPLSHIDHNPTLFDLAVLAGPTLA